MIYRAIAYNYSKEKIEALVTGKSYENGRFVFMWVYKAPMWCSAKYNVKFKTKKNDIVDIINSEKLYHNVSRGTTIWVTLKIGRNRKGKIKDWHILSYSWT